MLKFDQNTAHQDYFLMAIELEKRAWAVYQNEKNIASSPWLQGIYYLFSSKSSRLVQLGQECRSLLDTIEKKPVIIKGNETLIADQKNYHTACLKTAEVVKFILFNAEPDMKIKVQLEDVMQRVAALKYRITAANGGITRAAAESILTEKLCMAAHQWKNKQRLIENKKITQEEIKKLEEVSTYPEFCDMLLESKRLQEIFFSWSLRDNNEVAQFIEFPATAARIKSSYLSSRIGRLKGACQILNFEKSSGDIVEKMIALPFIIQNKAEYVSILDESLELKLDGGPPTTINNILKCFSKKNKEIGQFEIFRDGIRYWSCHDIGSIDLTLKDWWKQLPLVEEIDREELKKRSCGTLKDEEWVVFAKASRTTPDMDLDGRHGFFEIAIPLGSEKYSVYPFGIFPRKFPNTAFELVLFLGNTFRAKVSYPDENFFYSHRQQASHPIPLTTAEAEKFMKVLQKELILSKYGHQIFQFGAENCAFWSQKVLSTIENKAHNFYKLDYVESYPLNPILSRIFSLFRNIPLFIRNKIIALVDNIFGSSRGFMVFENGKKVFKSHRNSPVRNEFVIYQPGSLHQQIKDGKIKGQLFLGSVQ